MSSTAQSGYSLQSTSRFSQSSGSSYGYSAAQQRSYSPFGGSYGQSGIYGSMSGRFGEPAQTGLTSKRSKFNGFMGSNSEETRQNMNRMFMLFDDDDDDDEGGIIPPGPDNPVTPEAAIPLGEPILPLMLMLCGYAAWKRRQSRRETE